MGDAAPEGRPSRTHSTRHRAGGGGCPGHVLPRATGSLGPARTELRCPPPALDAGNACGALLRPPQLGHSREALDPLLGPFCGEGPRPSVPRSLSVRGSPWVCSKWGGLFPRQLLWVGLGCRLRRPRRGQAGGSYAWKAGTSLKGSGRSTAGWAQGQALLREGTLG